MRFGTGWLSLQNSRRSTGSASLQCTSRRLPISRSWGSGAAGRRRRQAKEPNAHGKGKERKPGSVALNSRVIWSGKNSANYHWNWTKGNERTLVYVRSVFPFYRETRTQTAFLNIDPGRFTPLQSSNRWTRVWSRTWKFTIVAAWLNAFDRYSHQQD